MVPMATPRDRRITYTNGGKMNVTIRLYKGGALYRAYIEPLTRGEEIFSGVSPEEAVWKAIAFHTGAAPWYELQIDPPEEAAS
jgi:hypothetical protein